MQRFYLENCNLKNNFILDNAELVHQIWVVLRSRVWDYFIFFNWVDFIDRIYKLQVIGKNALEFKFIEEIQKEKEELSLILFQSIPNKLEKIEYIVQKWTEIWYSKFVFFRSDRSQKLDLSDKKIQRLNKILIESSEQSGRNTVAELYFLGNIDFSVLVKDETLFCHTDKNNSNILSQTKIKSKNINIIVWPEGWWSENEVTNFENLEFWKIYLWNNILRCETVSSVLWFYFKQI